MTRCTPSNIGLVLVVVVVFCHFSHTLHLQAVAPPPLFRVRKKEITEVRKASRASKTNPGQTYLG